MGVSTPAQMIGWEGQCCEAMSLGVRGRIVDPTPVTDTRVVRKQYVPSFAKGRLVSGHFVSGGCPYIMTG